MGAFNQRFEALFPPSWSPGLRGLLCSPPFPLFIYARMWGRGVLPTAQPAPLSATLSPALWVYLCANVGPQGLLVVRLPAPFVPHSTSLGPATATRVLSTPVPLSAPPTSLDECLFCVSLVLDLLALRFSVSSGCARRRSVSTYTAILVLPKKTFKRWGDGSRQLSIYLSIYLSSVLSISHLSIYVSICIRYSFNYFSPW